MWGKAAVHLLPDTLRARIRVSLGSACVKLLRWLDYQPGEMNRAVPRIETLFTTVVERLGTEAPETERLLRSLDRVGVDAYRRRPNHHYVPDYYGRSAHKLPDIRLEAVFGNLARHVIADGRTLLYFDRLHTLFTALCAVRHLESATGEPLHFAEVGSYRGGSAYFITAAGAQIGMGPGDLHAFDTFEGHASIDIDPALDDARIHTPRLFGDTDYASVQAYLAPCRNVHLHKGRFQDTCSQVADLRFRFVHLDVDLYEPTAAGLQFFAPRLEPGGLIVVDDFGFVTCPGAKRAVDVFLNGQRDYALLPLLTGQCVLVKFA